jgi:aminoglycoside 3-N-acetyltransferase
MRSVQASHAVAAIGPRAAEYTADHLTNGIWAPNSPIGRLVHNGGYILAIGVSNETSTAYHVAEISLGAPCLDQFGDTDRIVLPDGTVKEVPGLAWRADNCPVDVKKKLDEALDARGLQSHGKVGRADATLVRALDLWTMRREHIQNVCPACTIRPHPRR